MIPPAGARVDWGHPLVPGCGWVPAMGPQTIHGDPVVVTAGTGTIVPHPGGRAFAPTNASTFRSWKNRINGAPKGCTMAVWAVGASSAMSDKNILSTSRTTANHCGLGMDDTAGNWTMMWNDESATWDYTGGPVPGGSQFFVGVYDSTVPSIKHYINGVLHDTNTGVTATLVNFNTETWLTGDSFISDWAVTAPSPFYLVWPRALTAAEVNELWIDPYCWLRF